MQQFCVNKAVSPAAPKPAESLPEAESLPLPDEGVVLRPTREAAPPLRPTREALVRPTAPFVPGPQPPKVAPAPRVDAPHGTVHSLRRPRAAGSLAPSHRSPEADSARRSTVVVARLSSEVAVDELMSALLPRAMEIRRLDPVGSAAASVTWSSLVRAATARTALFATALGVTGAIAGALMVRGEALMPPFGWLPGAIVGAALGAGLCGAIGFVIGALSTVINPSSTVSHTRSDDVFLIVRARSFDVDAIVASLVEAGGSITAIGET